MQQRYWIPPTTGHENPNQSNTLRSRIREMRAVTGYCPMTGEPGGFYFREMRYEKSY